MVYKRFIEYLELKGDKFSQCVEKGSLQSKCLNVLSSLNFFIWLILSKISLCFFYENKGREFSLGFIYNVSNEETYYN